MDAITGLIMNGIDVVGISELFVMVCRLIVLSLCLETFGVVCAHLGTAGRG